FLPFRGVAPPVPARHTGSDAKKSGERRPCARKRGGTDRARSETRPAAAGACRSCALARRSRRGLGVGRPGWGLPRRPVGVAAGNPDFGPRDGGVAALRAGLKTCGGLSAPLSE